MSAMIISAVLLLLAVTGSLTGFFNRSDIADSEYKERSSALADACADTMLYKLGADSSYTGDTTSTLVGSDTCRIFNGVTTVGSERTFNIQSNFQNACTNLEIKVDTDTLAVSSWREIPTHGSSCII